MSVVLEASSDVQIKQINSEVLLQMLSHEKTFAMENLHPQKPFTRKQFSHENNFLIKYLFFDQPLTLLKTFPLDN